MSRRARACSGRPCARACGRARRPGRRSARSARRRPRRAPRASDAARRPAPGRDRRARRAASDCVAASRSWPGARYWRRLVRRARPGRSVPSPKSTRELNARDRLDAGFRGLFGKFQRREEIIGVGDGERRLLVAYRRDRSACRASAPPRAAKRRCGHEDGRSRESRRSLRDFIRSHRPLEQKDSGVHSNAGRLRPSAPVDQRPRRPRPSRRALCALLRMRPNRSPGSSHEEPPQAASRSMRSRRRRRLEALEATPIAKPGGGDRAGLNSVGQRPGRRGRLTPELTRPR